MRARDFLPEGKLPFYDADPIITLWQFPDMPAQDPYQIYRFGLAMANQDATPDGPVNQNAVIGAYTSGEQEIINKASKITGHRGKLATTRGSKETPDTNKASIVANLNKKKVK